VITTTTETTLEELVDMINNDANNPGVTASTLYYDDKYHLVLNGNDAGGDYEISVNTSNTEILKSDSLFTADSDNATLSTKFTELDQFEGTLAGDEYITISGKTHDGTAFSQDFYINEYMTLNHLVGEIDDAFGETASAKLENGEIIVSDNTCGSSQMELSLAYNAGSGVTTFTMPTITQSVAGGSVSASLSGFGESDFAETQSAQDCQIKVDGFPGGEDDWIERSSNTIDDVISGVTLNLHDTGSVQVNMTRDIESIKENLNELVTAYNDVKNYIQENTSYDKTTKEAGLLMGDYIVSTIESQLRVPLINSAGGFQEDIETFLMPGQIGFSLDRDGLLEFDSIVFDQAIADDYMGVLSLIGADKTGSSDSNTIEFYGASSKYTTAGTYEVEVVITGGVITSAMIKHEDDTQWHEAEIDGNIITGAGGFDDNGNPLYAENSLQLTVDLSQSGTFDGSVRVKQGFAGAMEDSLDAILKTTTGALDVD
jgi:flagellar hook-associated protein 2